MSEGLKCLDCIFPIIQLITLLFTFFISLKKNVKQNRRRVEVSLSSYDTSQHVTSDVCVVRKISVELCHETHSEVDTPV